MTKQETETDVTIHNGGEGNGNLKKIFEEPFLYNFLRTFGENKNKLFRFKNKNTHSQKKIIVKTNNFR